MTSELLAIQALLWLCVTFFLLLRTDTFDGDCEFFTSFGITLIFWSLS